MLDKLNDAVKVLRQENDRRRVITVKSIEATGIALPKSKHSASPDEQLVTIHDIASKRRTDAWEVQSRFRNAFKRVTSVDVDRVNKANIADLTESQCKQALLLACKLVSDTNVHHLREVAMSSASEAHALFFERQFEHLLADALTYAVASEKLHMQQKTAFHDKICQQADKLVFVSNRAAVAVERQLECEAKMRNVEDESWDIRKRLAEANMELASLRWSMQVLSDKLEDAAKQLESSSLKGTQLEFEIDELQEKLRCSICMDRPKDTVFACGHTCCGECASEWKKCYYNCTSERRQKPVKYSFGIYL